MVHYSPHYRYHGAIAQMRMIEVMWRCESFTPEAKHKMARDVLSLWQLDEGYSVVNEYLGKVEQSLARRGDSETVCEGDLPLMEVLQNRQREHTR